MKPFRIFLISLGVFALFCAMVALALKRGANDGDVARGALNMFLSHSKNRNYDAAHAMLSDGLQSDISRTDLENQWKNYERVHGSIVQWKPALGLFVSGGQVNALPRFVQLRYLVQGSLDGNRNTAGAIYVKMTPQNGGAWRISQLQIRP